MKVTIYKIIAISRNSFVPSNVVRLCVAHRYRMSYVDTDIMFLSNTSDAYLSE